MIVKCPVCHRLFEPSDEEFRHSVAENGKKSRQVHTYIECGLPRYCSWSCFKKSRDLRFHGNAHKELAYKKQNRWMFHIGEIPPLPGSKEAKMEEEQYREQMKKSLVENPPRFVETGFSENISTVTLLPSQIFFGNPAERVLDDFAVPLGGEDGETYNFENE